MNETRDFIKYNVTQLVISIFGNISLSMMFKGNVRNTIIQLFMSIYYHICIEKLLPISRQ